MNDEVYAYGEYVYYGRLEGDIEVAMIEEKLDSGTYTVRFANSETLLVVPGSWLSREDPRVAEAVLRAEVRERLDAGYDVEIPGLDGVAVRVY